MANFPDRLRNYHFSASALKHLVCIAAEGRYEYTLQNRLFLPDGKLYNCSGVIVSKLVYASIEDPQELASESSFSDLAVIKNPLNATAIYDEEGYKNALIETSDWMYLATVRGKNLRIERPVRAQFYDNLTIYLAQATANIDLRLIETL